MIRQNVSDNLFSCCRSKSRSSSLSHSRSRSRSRSKSRSRSRSPIRYRRDRSHSGSPIRYRRDRYSPSRYRDNYGYRSRSRSRYRGYYRGGRGDSSWSYFRREWDRDRGRDYISHGHRRSRSRSRARRRSRTHSRSPRYRRGGSLSPRHRREDRLTGHRSRRSRSKEAKRRPSRSRSSSISRERGRLRKESTTVMKGSLSPKPKSGNDSDLLEVHSDSIENDRSLRRKSPRHSTRAERREKIKNIERKEVRNSPLRSLSVSPELSLRKIGKEHVDDDIDSTRHNRKLSGQRKRDDAGIDAHQSKLSMEEQVPGSVQHRLKVVNSDGWTLDDIGGSKSEDMSLNLSKEYHGELPGLLEKGKKTEQIGNLRSSEDEMEDGKELDDWRDDIKAYEKEKAMRKESRKESAIKEDKLIAQVVLLDAKDCKENTFQQHTNDSPDKFNQRGKELDQLTFGDIEVIQDMDHEDVNIRSLLDVKNGSYEKRYVAEDVMDRDINHVLHPGFQPMNPRGKIGEANAEENIYLSYNSDGGGKVHSHDSTYEDREGDLIYEGPVVAAVECVNNQQQKSQLEHVKKKEVMDLDYKLDEFHTQVSAGQTRTSGGRENFEEPFKRIKEMPHDEHVSHKRRGRERSTAKEEPKRDNDEFEKRKARHKKHRRKHRHQNSMEQDDEDDGDDSAVEGEGRRGKKRHTRKHRRDDEERRERKKKRHKDRVKAGSCSPSQSLANDEKDNVETDVMTANRKSSSRHKRRRKEASKSLSPSCDSGI
ncbi:hypothetical protein O6H91_07G109400 [Diphasiastrum complanatum]|uniref:Uncharacterized protein n=1 Tax=Diphasiastrum complanatum TaxID=34168 RepID=A0ACC2D902_DIPCM|nr:hypothetical protein O6H91_07G109400 [Diphasiastrum complanatum]